MGRTTLRTSIVSLALAGFTFAGLNACNSRGTDEVSVYGPQPSSDLKTGPVSFAALKKSILKPHACLKCHSEFSTEAGLNEYVVAGQPDQSSLYQAVLNGSMPQDLPALDRDALDIVKRYIEGLEVIAGTDGKEEVVPPTPDSSPTPSPSPEPTDPPTLPPVEVKITYTYLHEKLIVPSCLACHKPPRPFKGVDLSTYEGLVAHSEKVYGTLYATPPLKQMPPLGRPQFPQATEELKQDFRRWIDEGFAQ